MKRIVLLLAVLLAAIFVSSALAGGSFTFYAGSNPTTHQVSFATWYGSKSAPKDAHIAIYCQVTDPDTLVVSTVFEADKTITEWVAKWNYVTAVTYFDTADYAGLPCVGYLLRGGGSPLASASFTT